MCELKGFPSIKIGSTYRINSVEFEKWLKENEGSKIDLWLLIVVKNVVKKFT